MSFTAFERKTSPLYRSKLFVPGSQTKFFEKAAKSAADVICLDLEDAVAHFARFLQTLAYPVVEETANPVYRLFLR